MPAYEGDHYERLVPDTLDVADRADLAIQFITNLADPDADHEVYWPVLLHRNPPVMWHDWNGLAIQPKFQEALPLLRSLTGNESGSEVDETCDLRTDSWSKIDLLPKADRQAHFVWD